MPSPNGFFDCGASSNISRNWFRAQLTHDATSPPWPPVNAAAYEFEINIGTAAAGPFTPADLTGPGSDCSAPNPTNRTGFSTAAQTLFGVAGLDADTDYWLEVILHDENDVEVDRFVCGPTHTAAYPTFACAGGATGETTADVTLGSTTGRVNTTAPCNQDSIVWEIATTPGGPYTAAPSEPVSSLSPSHSFTGLTAGTTYYWRARLSEMQQSGGEYLVTQECSFTTEEAPVTTPPFDPQPCAGGGAGADAVDVEQIVLCDLDAEGNLLGTALAVYEYDTDGNPTGAPTFVDPATGDPYVPQGTLQPCPDAACLPPMQFCQTSTTTGPVEHPGRQYDLTLPINPGFAVQSLQVDAVSHAAGITWEVDDPDGETFRQNLTTFIEGRVPAAATVTITNPNAGVPQVCGAAQPMTVHIECLRLDQAPPDLIELIYNGGQDLIQNPAYNEFPALNPPVSQGNYGFRLLSRQDDPGPFPGNPPANDALCTSVANRGWETNDVGRTFEIWGQDIVNGSNVTPTPRGTPVQEMTSDGPPPGGLSTIWQTFQAPASGNFIIRVVHGARDPGETHRITLDNGDTDDAQNGDLIDDTTNPPSVTSNGGPNPWTQFSQTIPLNAGSTYTLALSSTNPVAGARGGLFTDMRAYIDRPDQRATAATDDETCVVTTEETTTNTVCSFWQPQCAGGVVVGWQKVDTGESLSNAEFWAQVPAPGCCLPDSGGEGEGSSTLSNMLTSDIVCATVGGIPQNAIRVMVTDPSGGTLQTLFLGTDGAPIAPDTWTPGACTTSRYMADQILCDDNGPFLRKYVQSLDATNQAQVSSFRDFTLTGTGYTVVGEVRQCGGDPGQTLGPVCWVSNPPVGSSQGGFMTLDADGDPVLYDHLGAVVPDGTYTIVICPERTQQSHVLCDAGNADHPFLRWYIDSPIAGEADQQWDFELDGSTPYVPIGPVGVCGPTDSADREVVCWTQTSTGDEIHTGTIRHDDALPPPGWLLFDQHQTLVNPAEPGLTFVPCGGGCDTASSIGTICYTPPIAVQTLQDDWTGATSVLGGGSRVWTNPNFANQGITVTETVTPDTGAALLGAGVRNTATSPATQHTAIDLGAPRTNVTVRLDFFGSVQGERLRNVTPAFGAVSGNGTAVLANTGVDGGPAGDGTIFLTFPGPVQNISWDYAPTGSGLSGQTFISFNTGNASNSAPAAVLRDCATGETTFIDLATGTELDPSTISIVDCPDAQAPTAIDQQDVETLILCDSTPTRFLRAIKYDAETGAVLSVANTALDGTTPFAPVGAVGVCTTAIASDFDFLSTVLCDANGTQFIQRLTFNSATGAVTATTNTTLTGAAFAPVAPVALCSNCCPAVIGEGCTNTGSGFYTAIRAANGTISLIDSVTGAAVLAANIVPCPGDDTVRTLTAQARLVGDADTPWSPGADVVGTLTSVTMTVLTGTATLTDQSGTVLAGLPAGFTATWSAEDDNVLNGPTSIDAIGGNTVVHWTQR